MLTAVSKYLLIAAGILIVILGGLVYHYKLLAADYQVQIANITAGADVAAEKQATKQLTIDQAITVKKLTEENGATLILSGEENAVQIAPKSDDGQVALVLSRALAGLRVKPAAH